MRASVWCRARVFVRPCVCVYVYLCVCVSVHAHAREQIVFFLKRVRALDIYSNFFFFFFSLHAGVVKAATVSDRDIDSIESLDRCEFIHILGQKTKKVRLHEVSIAFFFFHFCRVPVLIFRPLASIPAPLSLFRFPTSLKRFPHNKHNKMMKIHSKFKLTKQTTRIPCFIFFIYISSEERGGGEMLSLRKLLLKILSQANKQDSLKFDLPFPMVIFILFHLHVPTCALLLSISIFFFSEFTESF